MEHHRAVTLPQPAEQFGGGFGDQDTRRGMPGQKNPCALFEYDTSRFLVC